MPSDSAQVEPGQLAFTSIGRSRSVPRTHAYHHYPMRFIPQLARRLISSYSSPEDIVADPFMGSGTVLVEALSLGRSSWGVDVNPMAVLTARAKTEPHDPHGLDGAVRQFLERLSPPHPIPIIPQDRLDRLRWWFPEENIRRLGILLTLVSETPCDLRAFFTCAFSSILKRCSRWSPDSIKAIRSEKRHRSEVAEPFKAITAQLELMRLGNSQLWTETRQCPDLTTRPMLGDARSLTAEDGSVGLIVTSPPYLTAYDYVEVFELSLLWLNGGDLGQIRRAVIGTRAIGGKAGKLDVRLDAPWRKTVEQVFARHPATGVAVARYYQDMERSLLEAVRVLRSGGRIALVVGDSVSRSIPLQNTAFFSSILERAGLRPVFCGRRQIVNRSLPPFRDPITGRFLKRLEPGGVVAYPTEAVMVFQKEAKTPHA